MNALTFSRLTDSKSAMFKIAHAIARLTAKDAGSYAMALQATVKDLNAPINKGETVTVQNVGSYFVISNQDDANMVTFHRICKDGRILGKIKCTSYSALGSVYDIVALLESAKANINEHIFKYNDLEFLNDDEYDFFEGNGIYGLIY